MTKDQFQQNLNLILAFYKQKQKELRDLNIGVKYPGKERDILEKFLETIGLEKNEETLYVAFMRLSMLKEDSLVLYINTRFSEDEKKMIIHKSYEFCADYHRKIQDDITAYIEENNFLTPFYLTVWKSIQDVGISFNKWFPDWKKKIIFDVNHTLEKLFDGDGGKVMQYLLENNLFDTGYEGKKAPRCYSILTPQNSSWKSISYREAFPEVMQEIISKLHYASQKLQNLEDEIFGQKQQYINYFLALENAFSETDTSKLVPLWGEVDVTWMQITTPLQPTHPLEYYEDNYRNSVAPEWDMRIVDESILSSQVSHDMFSMYETFYDEKERKTYKESYDFSLESMKRVQLYISTPVLYYGAGLAGLPSAQVVPNDREVSDAYGKKIFAFPEFVLMARRSQPKMKLSEVIFEKSFLDAYYSFINEEESLYYKVYDIETIGHEYGHTLWLYKDSEEAMNVSGLLSNIEEWKATAGGLVAFFSNPSPILKPVLLDHVSRSVGLMRYREVEQILPYYCEGIIHLTLLFSSQVLAYENGKIVFQPTDKNIENLKDMYKKTYQEQRKIYLEKRDAGEFLFEYIVREDGIFMPKDKKTREFVEDYYSLYKKIGNEIVS